MCYVPPKDPDMSACHDALWNDYLEELKRITLRSEYHPIIDAHITIEELYNAITESQNNKSPGPDSVTYEML